MSDFNDTTEDFNDVDVVNDDVIKDEVKVKEKFEVRKFNDNREYRVLVIDSADKWEDADKFNFIDVVQKGNNKVEVKFKCVSLESNAYINENFPVPEAKTGIEETSPEFVSRVDSVRMIRKAIFFERSLGVTLKGKDTNEKASYLATMPAVYVDKLFEIINQKACAISEGKLPEFYKNSSEGGEKIKKVSSEDLFDFDDTSDATSFCRIQRPFEDYLIEFPLKQLSAESRNDIEREHAIPEPPMRPGKGFDVENPVPFTDEPQYKARVARIKMKKSVAYIEACLSFEIPGSTPKEKHEWISKKICGDVIKLQVFIQNEIIDYTWGVNLF